AAPARADAMSTARAGRFASDSVRCEPRSSRRAAAARQDPAASLHRGNSPEFAGPAYATRLPPRKVQAFGSLVHVAPALPPYIGIDQGIAPFDGHPRDAFGINRRRSGAGGKL